jgi:hypothetical protein
MTRTMRMVKLFRNIPVLFISVGLTYADVARAQVPVGSPPPTYDYIPAEPGTQPPNVLGGPFTARELRTHTLRVGVRVPLAELQALLPPGFTARANPVGSNTALVNLTFAYQIRLERPGVGAGFGNFGPYSSLNVDTSVLNPDNVIEGLFELVHLVSDPDVALLRNDIFGPGSSRAATLKFEIEEEEGSLRIKVNAEDEELGLDLRAEGKGPSRFATRFGGNNLALSRFQNQDNSAMANSQVLTAFQGDNAGGQPAANVKLNTTQLRLPGGEFHVIEITGFTFIRNLELFYRIP